MSNTATEERESAERQIGLFEEQFSEQYDEEYAAAFLEYAYHAAFPLTLTTELAYLLRQRLQEKYDIYLPWTAAPELLLSNLCDAIGSDLYSMSGELRRALLERLAEYYGADRIEDLGLWMASYIKYRIQVDKRLRAQILGEPTEWIALAWLKRTDRARDEIVAYLRELLQKSDDLKDIIRWSSMDENMPEMLLQSGLRPIEWEALMAEIEHLRSGGDEVDRVEDLTLVKAAIAETEIDRIKESIAKAEFPLLQSKDIECATISVKETAIESGDVLDPFEFKIETGETLYPFEFETVRVNERGEIIHRGKRRVSVFREPLAPEIGLEMVVIPGGKFMMGSLESEHDRWDNESPQHQVTVQPFFIGKYPITQAQWRSIANTAQIDRQLELNPSYFKGDLLPVYDVSWEDAIEFCKRLSRATMREYRLPTEAEWEYACRARTSTPFHFGETITGKLANYCSSRAYLYEQETESQHGMTPVGNFSPNDFGLYDMHGNVLEWCLDQWHNNYQGAPTDGSAWLLMGTNHILRGGSHKMFPHYCRSATRINPTTYNLHRDFGVRVVCDIIWNH